VDLTTADRLKTFLDVSGSGEDTLLGYLVTAISAQVEAYLDRYVESTSRTAYLDVEEGQRVFGLRGYPVTSVSSLRHDIDWTFASTDELATTDYTVLGDDGLLQIPAYDLAAGPRALKITYTGGMAASAAAFYAAYPDAELAVWYQAGYAFERRKFLIDGSAAVAGSSVGFQAPELLAEVKELLRPYRRLVVV